MQVVDVQAVVVVEVAYDRNVGLAEKESFFVIFPHCNPTLLVKLLYCICSDASVGNKKNGS
jgi:hypothetical protein